MNFLKTFYFKGTEISEEDIINIRQLCDEIIAIHEYRTHLYEYLKTRMMAIAPNLTVLVGETVGARLIAHAGSLVNLAKHPASTVQILGKSLSVLKLFGYFSDDLLSWFRILMKQND